ncbi:hypothetical protein [Streptomyces canus]|uniref:hypothetical protein n=1 Tax=Streptomyces canus TaxID=58343 RepID=UPI003245117B
MNHAPETVPAIPTGPRDEAVVSYGLHAKRQSDLALELLAHDLDAPPGAQVRQALALSDWLDRLVSQAAVAEHEDGASWRATGRHALNGGGDGRAAAVALALAYARRDGNHLRTVFSSTLHVIRFPEQANAARARPGRRAARAGRARCRAGRRVPLQFRAVPPRDRGRPRVRCVPHGSVRIRVVQEPPPDLQVLRPRTAPWPGSHSSFGDSLPVVPFPGPEW